MGMEMRMGGGEAYSDVPRVVSSWQDLVWGDLGRAEWTEAEAYVDVAIED